MNFKDYLLEDVRKLVVPQKIVEDIFEWVLELRQIVLTRNLSPRHKFVVDLSDWKYKDLIDSEIAPEITVILHKYEEGGEAGGRWDETNQTMHLFITKDHSRAQIKETIAHEIRHFLQSYVKKTTGKSFGMPSKETREIEGLSSQEAHHTLDKEFETNLSSCTRNLEELIAKVPYEVRDSFKKESKLLQTISRGNQIKHLFKFYVGEIPRDEVIDAMEKTYPNFKVRENYMKFFTNLKRLDKDKYRKAVKRTAGAIDIPLQEAPNMQVTQPYSSSSPVV